MPALQAARFEPGPGEPAQAHEARRPPDDDPQAFAMPWIADGLDHETVAALLDDGPPSVKATFAGWQAAYTDRLSRWWR